MLINPELVAAIVRDAGGEVIGRTRLQQIAYLLDVVGFGDGFSFSCKHYGPYSEGVADSAALGVLLERIAEVEKQADWGGVYSIYSVNDQPDDGVPPSRREFACKAKNSNAVALELAGTAVFLSRANYDDPWFETVIRKPEKSESGRLTQAMGLLTELKRIDVPIPLPDNV